MKSIRIVLLSLVVTFLCVFLTSFFNSYNKKAFATVCYYYSTGLGTLTPAKVSNSANWVSIAQSSIEKACPGSCKLCSICFDDTQFTGTAGQRKQQAINVLAAYITAGNDICSLPDPSAIVQNGKVLIVYQREVE